MVEKEGLMIERKWSRKIKEIIMKEPIAIRRRDRVLRGEDFGEG